MIASKKVISRLSKYRHTLGRLNALGFTRIFSEYLAEKVGVNPSQVRKDFSVVGIKGNKRGGYIIEEMLAQLDEILGKGEVQKVIIVGVGNLGRALLNYKGFERDKITVAASFDIDPAKQKDSGHPVPVLPLGLLDNFVKTHRIKVGILSVPEMEAQQVFEQMVASGIIGVLNFAPIQLKSTKKCHVNNVNLEMELENLFYFVNTDKMKTPSQA